MDSISKTVTVKDINVRDYVDLEVNDLVIILVWRNVSVSVLVVPVHVGIIGDKVFSNLVSVFRFNLKETINFLINGIKENKDVV